MYDREIKLTDRDIAHLRDSLDDADDADGGPAVVMTSAGYVELWSDGSVYAFNRYVGNVLEDDEQS